MAGPLKAFVLLVLVNCAFAVIENNFAKAEDDTSCDPNYTGACVPIASDVDCSSGKGNGPAYVVGPVTVVGDDIYGLDHDHDGIGCEKG